MMMRIQPIAQWSHLPTVLLSSQIVLDQQTNSPVQLRLALQVLQLHECPLQQLGNHTGATSWSAWCRSRLSCRVLLVRGPHSNLVSLCQLPRLEQLLDQLPAVLEWDFQFLRQLLICHLRICELQFHEFFDDICVVACASSSIRIVLRHDYDV